MATPRTAAEFAAMNAEFHRIKDRKAGEFLMLYQQSILSRIFEPRLRPRTDDMMQMCVDLGIEVPDRRISYDDRYFYFDPPFLWAPPPRRVEWSKIHETTTWRLPDDF